MRHGGKRKGAGRPLGKGPYAAATKTMRVPLMKVNEVKRYLHTDGYKLRLYSSRVPAGIPADADDHYDQKIDLNSLILTHPKESYLLTVSGDSMIDVGIDDKDILVVDSKLEAKNSDIVVASVDGQATVKRLSKKRSNVTLMPENKKYKPIEITAETDCKILGVVTRVIKSVHR